MAKKLATAIDIGADSVKVVQLEETSSGIKLVNFGIERYPRPDIDAEVSDDTIVSALRNVLSQANIKTKSAVISIPRALVTQKRLNFQTRTSALTEEEIDEMVALQAEVEIPFGANNAIYDHHNIQKSPEGMSAELVAARKETIARYLGILKSAGLQADAILPSTYAISAVALNQLASNNMEVNYEATATAIEKHEYTVMVIDIGAEYTDLCLLRSNRIAFSRSFPIGGDRLTKAYAKEQGLSYENAEEYKISNSNLEVDLSESVPTYEWAERLSEELQRSIQAFGRDMLGAEKVDNIWMCGCGATIPGLAQYITDSLEIPAELWNPLAAFESNLPAELPEKMKYTFAVSLGLGLNALTNKVSVNLLPAEEVQRKEKAKQRLFTLSYAAAALILIVGISVGANTWISSRNAHLEEINLRLQAVQKASEQAIDLLIDDLVMTKMLSPRVSPLDILKELSENFPDRTKVALTNFTLDRTQKITLNVEANSHAEISNLISKLGRSKLFTDITSGQISTTEKKKGKQILQAQVVCKLSNNAAKYVKELKELAAKKSQSAPKKIQDEGVIRRTSMRNPE
ncbi:TPA: type IV pilus assembly protein PilM [Candidatus Poribacteria bacterium]|nr:type IV pilus assembly protein PilM [Candidatus Poribacteria bacterium]